MLRIERANTLKGPYLPQTTAGQRPPPTRAILRALKADFSSRVASCRRSADVRYFNQRQSMPPLLNRIRRLAFIRRAPVKFGVRSAGHRVQPEQRSLAMAPEAA